MTRIVVQRTLPVDAKRLWDVLSDLPNAHLFLPFVQETDLIGDRDGGVGAERVHYLENGGEMVERFTRWIEGEGYAAEIAESPLPIQDARLSVDLSPAGAASCVVRVEVRYETRGGLLGRLVDAVMLHALVHRFAEDALRGLALHARAAVHVGPDGEALGVSPRRVWRRVRTPV